MVHSRFWLTTLRASTLVGCVLLLWMNSERALLPSLRWKLRDDPANAAAQRSSDHTSSMNCHLSFDESLPVADEDHVSDSTTGTTTAAATGSSSHPLSSTNTTPGQWPALDTLISDGTRRVNDTHGTRHVPSDWPRLDSLVEGTGRRIKGDVQFMLDFAILAHPKTATSSTMLWLNSHDEILMHNYELHSLALGRPADFVTQLYDLPPGRQYKRGYKAPRDLFNGPAMSAISQYWPKTKLIVGLRHPVWWFQSFYNFRVQMGYKMPPAESLLGRATHAMFDVSTDEAKFHQHLDHLGKTPRSSKNELALLAWNKKQRPPTRRMKNKVFLYEINQLRDTNSSRADSFRSDLKLFLELRSALDPIPLRNSSGGKATGTMDVCDPKLTVVRQELMKHARAASSWIRDYFLKSNDVFVSSPLYFDHLLKSWTLDPCSRK